MTKNNNLQGAKTMLVLLAIAATFVAACKKSGSNPTPAQAAASAAAATAAAQTTLLSGKWADGKEEQKVYDSTKKLVVDTIFNTGNNYHYDQYSNGTFYYVDNEFALDTQEMYHFKVAGNKIAYTDLNDAGYTLANIVQLTSANLEIEYDFSTSGPASVQVQMFHLDSAMKYTVNYTRYYAKMN